MLGLLDGGGKGCAKPSSSSVSSTARSFLKNAGGLLDARGVTVPGEWGSRLLDLRGAEKGRRGRTGRVNWVGIDEDDDEDEVEMTDALRERSTSDFGGVLVLVVGLVVAVVDAVVIGGPRSATTSSIRIQMGFARRRSR
jgi:hypothetical protein